MHGIFFLALLFLVIIFRDTAIATVGIIAIIILLIDFFLIGQRHNSKIQKKRPDVTSGRSFLYSFIAVSISS